MVAYSFNKRFIPPILSGRKHQTIRSIGRRRHAKVGELLQLYTGMRTKGCRLILRSPCTWVTPITINFVPRFRPVIEVGEARFQTAFALNRFAESDGFKDFDDMAEFWATEHPGVERFEGVLIQWAPPIDLIEEGSTVK